MNPSSVVENATCILCVHLAPGFRNQESTFPAAVAAERIEDVSGFIAFMSVPANSEQR